MVSGRIARCTSIGIAHVAIDPFNILHQVCGDLPDPRKADYYSTKCRVTYLNVWLVIRRLRALGYPKVTEIRLLVVLQKVQLHAEAVSKYIDSALRREP